MKNKKYKTAEIAAQWWADQLDGNAKQDNGTEDFAFLMLMIKAASENQGEPKEKREVFKKELEEMINDALAKSDNLMLCVDYNAEGLLYDAATKCDIRCGVGSSFPVKTEMYVTKTNVSVSNGYRAPEQILFEEKPKKTPLTF